MTNNEQVQERWAYTVAEAAATLGISRSAMYRLVTEGEVETITFGRSRRVPRRALMALTGGELPGTTRSAEARARTPTKRTIVLVEIDTLVGGEPDVRIFLNGKQL